MKKLKIGKAFAQTPGFLRCQEWRKLRMRALKRDKGRCQCCGASAHDGVRLHVDHIKPRQVRPDLALALNNLQTLCEDCNVGKGAWDDTDWREYSIGSIGATLRLIK